MPRAALTSLPEAETALSAAAVNAAANTGLIVSPLAILKAEAAPAPNAAPPINPLPPLGRFFSRLASKSSSLPFSGF